MLIAMALAAAAPAFDPRTLKAGMAGPPSRLLVLGTPHLSGLPDAFVPAHLAPLLDRLATWRPDAIAIESLGGMQCELLFRYKARFHDAADDYCWDPAPARATTGLDVASALDEVDRLLGAWPARPTAAQRRRLAAVFIAAGDRASALVQWLRLDPADRRAGEGLDDALVAVLAKGAQVRNENYAIAATLAARLGLERVYPVDDHTADESAPTDPRYEEALARIWSGPATKARKDADTAARAGLGTPAGTLAYYRHLNDPAQARIIFDSDFGAALSDATPERWGRRYVGWWETRNLRMVANMRAVMATRPGMRMLAVVGASHKFYYEAYMAPMTDVAIADIAPLLR